MKIGTVLMLVLVPHLAAAQGRSQIINATVEARAVSGSMAREIETAVSVRRSVWIAYRVPIVSQRQDWCSDGARTTRVMLEPPTAITVLARIEGGALVRLRSVTDGCDIDAGGIPVTWLDGVSSDLSAQWLTTLVRGTDARTRDQQRIADAALSVLVWHTGKAPLDAVIDLAKHDASPSLRGRALFWLALRAGQEATSTISTAIDTDPDTAVKRKAVFALSQLPHDDGVPLLIQVARTNANRDVRRQAMFWLAQSKDPRALAFFEDVLRR